MFARALFFVAACAAAQQPSPLEIAKAIDLEIRQLKDAPEADRARGVRELAMRIRRQPQKFAADLATNLAIDHADVSDAETVQEIAGTLEDVLRNWPAGSNQEPSFRTLAELARYNHARVSLRDPRYAAALRALDAEEEKRRHAEFRLTDLHGKKWALNELRGKVVLVNFWATWCPPCRKEMPDLKALADRFKDQGLVVVAISDESADVLNRFVAEEKVTFPVLLDPDGKGKGSISRERNPGEFSLRPFGTPYGATDGRRD
jgi:thiol-disulfide isomerase/thioredoxin